MENVSGGEVVGVTIQKRRDSDLESSNGNSQELRRRLDWFLS